MIGFTTAVSDLKTTVGGYTSRIALAAAFGVAVLLVVIVTLWFLGDALLALFEEHGFRHSAAAGLTGLAGLVLAALLGLAAKIATRPRVPAVSPVLPSGQPRPSTGNIVNDLALDLGSIAAAQVRSTVRSHPYGTMGASLVAGLALGALPELRKALFDLAAKR